MKTRTDTLTTYDSITGLMPAIALSIGMALLIALSARLSFLIPLSPVPVTLQVAAVIFAGFILGPRWGALSSIFYFAIGLLGAPVFAMGLAGPAIFVQPSLGYILGFPAAAWVVGTLAEKYGRNIVNGIWIGLIGVGIIYLCGASWMSGYLAIGGMNPGSALLMAWTAGIVPFIVVDGLKVVLVSGLWNVFSSRAGK